MKKNEEKKELKSLFTPKINKDYRSRSKSEKRLNLNEDLQDVD